MPPAESPAYSEIDPKVEAMVHELIGRVADKWTLLVVEELEENGTLRFTQLSRNIPGISQKMLTQTLRQMERDGLVHRTVHAVVPPKVEYRLTELGHGLSESFCGVWRWVETNLGAVEAARHQFDTRLSG
jgi:DNA-binding HxlR family transcriptional regulator